MPDSVSQWIAGIKSRDDDAARHLWERYSAQLLDLARRQLASAPAGPADEEDVAQSVFASVCRGAALGRFRTLKNRDELWWLLVAITRRKAISQLRREAAQKRGGGLQRTPAAAAQSLDELVANEPTPEFLVLMEEEHRRLLSKLRDDRLRQIATARVEGYTVEEIACQHDVSKRSIERKLKLIRNHWAAELEP